MVLVLRDGSSLSTFGDLCCIARPARAWNSGDTSPLIKLRVTAEVPLEWRPPATADALQTGQKSIGTEKDLFGIL